MAGKNISTVRTRLMAWKANLNFEWFDDYFREPGAGDWLETLAGSTRSTIMGSVGAGGSPYLSQSRAVAG